MDTLAILHQNFSVSVQTSKPSANDLYFGIDEWPSVWFLFGVNAETYAPWDTFVSNQILFWHDIIAKKMMEFRQSGRPVLVVQYEDLRKNHTKEVCGIYVHQ